MTNTITVVGIGAGDFDQLTIGVLRTLKNAPHLFLRTKEHPVVKDLENEGITFTSFDSIYESHDSFDEVYQEIVSTLFEKAKEQDIVYGVPGHPFVAERAVQLLVEGAKSHDIKIDVKGGQSFLDPIFNSLQIDPIEGFQLLDGTALDKSELKLTQHMLIAQVYDQFVASDVKLTLMEHLPDEHEVYIVTAAGSTLEKITKVPLYELDHDMTLSNLTTVYVPPVTKEEILYHQFESLRSIIATLRGPNGCPWDKKQTHQSLKPYLLEESYELLEAIDEEDDQHVVEELGDVLLQVMLHAQIGEDEGFFTIDDVIRTLSEKMIRRHPHVFGDVQAEDADEVLKNWNAIKQEEKQTKPNSLLDSIPKSLPGLMMAYQIQKKAGKVGFDWNDVAPMWEKVSEEIEEFKAESANEEPNENMLKEFGDVLFAFVNIARYYQLDPEVALQSTNQKFTRRFQYIEKRVKESNKAFEDYTLEELDQYWNEAKKNGL
ncbi:nucleoside triphosphate pyrophosphohydrolase [Priestia koreensis]|uniref:Nucleoside triphosphate pyrophosphohydrolase n=1 Tax=Priestia koreensis TaxID=284581 RepID=A0A0M0KUN0_9BACI|nr:nucleoside triphosphate pyrophosphohydrolase [Priestia koreensis]KOO42337.1 hypothetical protein AMD01_18370 [Priestia koreensis]